MPVGETRIRLKGLSKISEIISYVVDSAGQFNAIRIAIIAIAVILAMGKVGDERLRVFVFALAAPLVDFWLLLDPNCGTVTVISRLGLNFFPILVLITHHVMSWIPNVIDWILLPSVVYFLCIRFQYPTHKVFWISSYVALIATPVIFYFGGSTIADQVTGMPMIAGCIPMAIYVIDSSNIWTQQNQAQNDTGNTQSDIAIPPTDDWPFIPDVKSKIGRDIFKLAPMLKIDEAKVKAAKYNYPRDLSSVIDDILNAYKEQKGNRVAEAKAELVRALRDDKLCRNDIADKICD